MNAINAIDVLNALQPFLYWLTEQSRVRQPVALEAPGLEAGTYFVTAGGELLVHGSQRVQTLGTAPNAVWGDGTFENGVFR